MLVRRVKYLKPNYNYSKNNIIWAIKTLIKCNKKPNALMASLNTFTSLNPTSQLKKSPATANAWSGGANVAVVLEHGCHVFVAALSTTPTR